MRAGHWPQLTEFFRDTVRGRGRGRGQGGFKGRHRLIDCVFGCAEREASAERVGNWEDGKLEERPGRG